MSFDFKKEYKEFYLPKQQPQTVCIPKMNFIAVKGKGDPNQENGECGTAAGRIVVAGRYLRNELFTQR